MKCWRVKIRGFPDYIYVEGPESYLNGVLKHLETWGIFARREEMCIDEIPKEQLVRDETTGDLFLSKKEK